MTWSFVPCYRKQFFPWLDLEGGVRRLLRIGYCLQMRGAKQENLPASAYWENARPRQPGDWAAASAKITQQPCEGSEGRQCLAEQSDWMRKPDQIAGRQSPGMPA